MASSLGLKLSCMVLLCMMVAAPLAQAITCGQVVSNLTPCISYLKGTVPTVPGACCSGVKNLNNAAKTTADRQTACECLKQTSTGIPGLQPARAAGLPGKCGVNIPYKISTSTNCKNVK